jgi:hypothetical protein
MSDERLRQAASIISELLVSTLLPLDDKPMRDWLNPWERDAMIFLSEQRKIDGRAWFNEWTAKRVTEFEDGKFRYDQITEDE